MTLTSLEAKWISMLVVGIGSFVIGVIPACYVSRGRVITRKLLLSSLLCFGGGVLLATSVLHMLPETRETLPDYAELVFCCGFLLLYLVDEIVHYFWIRDDAANAPTQPILTLSDEPTAQSVKRTHQRGPSTCLSHGLPNRRPRYQDQSQRHDIYEIGFSTASRNVPGTSAQEGLASLSYEPSNVTKTNRSNVYGGGSLINKPKATQYGTLSPITTDISSCCTETETLLCHGNHVEPCAKTNTGHVGLSLALTFHALLEGLAIGLQKDSYEVFLLAGAVVSHKFVVAFCLGLELAESASSLCRNILAIGLFSGGSALGIGIGMFAIKVEGSWAGIMMTVLQGLAGGTLLYVTVSEVLPRERARWHKNARRSAGIIQFFSVFIGFTLIYFLNNYLDFDHHVLPKA